MQCKQNSGSSSQGNASGSFIKMNSSETNVTFENKIKETEAENVLIYDGYYQGAGCAVIDVDKDGLQDLFFVANQGEDKLYLNKGNFKFDDITSSAQVQGSSEWASGVTVADVNADGWDDIYICCNLYSDPSRRRNKLYINQKNNSFIESAEKYGVADEGYSMHAVFFDYDMDGDLDLLVANQPPNQNGLREDFFEKHQDLDIYTSHLYRNDGNEHFTNVTNQCGLRNFAYTLSVSIGDFFNDGYPDIYMANDYDEGDFYYQNNGNGTFTEVSHLVFQHVSNFSMGSDVADINNDGWLDLFVADMVSEDHYRNKANMAGMNPDKFWKLANEGHHLQYMFNCLHLNNGNGMFSDIALMAGVSKTDWSWASLFSDFDNDGNKDLLITNGILRDIRNRDFLSTIKSPAYSNKSYLEKITQAPSVPIQNYLYRNDGNLHYEKYMDKWGLTDKTFSQGAVYADLDNDGDMDLVINNTNQEALIYQNKISDNRFLNIKLIGEGKNVNSIGARVFVCYDTIKNQMSDIYSTRGFLSACEPMAHFGLAHHIKVDSVLVRWPSGKFIKLSDVKTNQTITLHEKDAKDKRPYQFFQNIPFRFTQEVTDQLFQGIRHVENNFNDFKREILIPYKQSTLGPSLDVADVNGDGLEDIFLGGSIGHSAQLFFQKQDGSFIPSTSKPWSKYQNSESIDAKFFDLDGDKDLDLYVASGGNESTINSMDYLDHLYINDGKGNFTDATSRLPNLSFSKSCIEIYDIDGDGDKDLFIGGRLVPGKYGMPTRSAILINENGKFVDQTTQWCSELARDFGCVTDAVWTDINKDGSVDLAIVGEWMPIRIFIQKNKVFIDQSKAYGTDQLYGWWNCIKSIDIDEDGDQDLFAGNSGLNSKFKASIEKPFMAYINDFDKNGTWDTYLAYKQADGKIYPVRGRQCSSEQMPFIEKKYADYNSFASVSVDNILEGKMDDAIVLKATEFKSMVLLNNGGNSFITQALVAEAQIAPIQDFQFIDVDHDQHKDIVLAGNYFNREVETTRSDAGVGTILLNRANKFPVVPSFFTGLKLTKDLRKLALLHSGGKNLIIGANNNDKLQAFMFVN